MVQNGEYTPQSVENAVSVSAHLYRFFNDNNIEVLRIGLPDGDDLRKNFVAGAYHPSLGEMVISRDVRNRIEEELTGRELDILVNPRFLSKVNGNRKCNVKYFEEKGIQINIIIDSLTDKYKIRKS